MFHDLRYRVLRKINQARCGLIFRKQPKCFNNLDFGYLTIFHDYESHFAQSDAAQSSHYGINFILDVEKKYNIRATYNIVGMLVKDTPEIVSRIISDGHELASHSYEHRIQADLSQNEVRCDLMNTKKIFDSFGIKLQGFRSPQSKWTFSQMHALLKEGLLWSAEADNAEFPYRLLKRGEHELIRMPILVDDWEYKSKMIRPESMLTKLLDKVESIAKQKVYGAIGFHPWVQGEEDQRLQVFSEFIEIVSSRKDLKILNFGKMYDLYMKLRFN